MSFKDYLLDSYPDSWRPPVQGVWGTLGVTGLGFGSNSVTGTGGPPERPSPIDVANDRISQATTQYQNGLISRAELIRTLGLDVFETLRDIAGEKEPPKADVVPAFEPAPARKVRWEDKHAR